MLLLQISNLQQERGEAASPRRDAGDPPASAGAFRQFESLFSAFSATLRPLLLFFKSAIRNPHSFYLVLAMNRRMNQYASMFTPRIERISIDAVAYAFGIEMFSIDSV